MTDQFRPWSNAQHPREVPSRYTSDLAATKELAEAISHQSTATLDLSSWHAAEAILAYLRENPSPALLRVLQADSLGVKLDDIILYVLIPMSPEFVTTEAARQRLVEVASRAAMDAIAEELSGG